MEPVTQPTPYTLVFCMHCLCCVFCLIAGKKQEKVVSKVCNFFSEKMYDSPGELKELELDGSLRKKYTDASNPNEIHYILIVKQKDGTRRKLDLYRADPVFFDQVAVPQRLKKQAGSLDVQITRFSKPDTTISLKFLAD